MPQRLIARALAPVDLLEDSVDHLQDDVVEHPLLVRERLDVPAQQRPQQLLDGQRDPPFRPRPALQRPIGADGPEPLGAVARRKQLPATRITVLAPGELLAQLRDKCGYIDRTL